MLMQNLVQIEKYKINISGVATTLIDTVYSPGASLSVQITDCVLSSLCKAEVGGIRKDSESKKKTAGNPLLSEQCLWKDYFFGM